MDSSGKDAVRYFDPKKNMEENASSSIPSDESIFTDSGSTQTFKAREPSSTPARKWPDTAIQRQIAAAAAMMSGAQVESRRSARVQSNDRQPQKKYRMGLVVLASAIVLTALSVVLISERTDSVAGRNDAEGSFAFQSIPQWLAQAFDTKVGWLNRDSKAAISIPLDDVSLKQNPQLFEQIVQIYRTQLKTDANDTASLSTLSWLKEQTLNELEELAIQNDTREFERAAALATRLFPELNGNSRVLSATARIESVKPTMDPSASSAFAYAAAEHSTSEASNSGLGESENKIAAMAKNQITDVMVTPGVIIGDRFVPRDKGNIFSVSFNYRNFETLADGKSGIVTLVARLGYAGESMPFAEVPIEVGTGVGTKNFLIGTLLSADKTLKYDLNFLLDNEFLISKTVELSQPVNTQLGIATATP